MNLVLKEAQGLIDEVEELKMRLSDSQMLGLEIHRLHSTLHQTRRRTDSFDVSARGQKVFNKLLERSHLKEDIIA